MKTVKIPNNWTPREYQRPMWVSMERGCRRAVLLWHRRAGKDDNSGHFLASRAVQKAATYWYMLPQYNQARKAMWDAVNPHTGKRRIDEWFPQAIRRRTRDQEMSIEFVNGSNLFLVGSDNFNSLVGSPPYGIIFSEYSLTSPLAWAYLQPILEENGGWVIFNFTARGRNHAATLYESKLRDPEWFVQRCTPDDTKVFGAEQLDRIRRDLIDLYGEDDGDAIFRQEYWCSFDAALIGAYFSRAIEDLESRGQVGAVPYDPAMQVFTSWDLGMDDSTAIWFFQANAREFRVIDYYEANGFGLDHYVKMLKDKPYVYGGHFLPHDVKVRELGSGRSRLETLNTLGIQTRDVTVLPAQNPADRVQAVRNILPRCWFDAEKCAPGLSALRQYRREYDEVRKVYKDRPYHDWTSHASDAFGQFCLGFRERLNVPVAPKYAMPKFHTKAWMGA